jgi:hypothetical protein
LNLSEGFVYTGEVSLAKMPATATFGMCLGFMGGVTANRIVPVCFLLPKEPR